MIYTKDHSSEFKNNPKNFYFIYHNTSIIISLLGFNVNIILYILDRLILKVYFSLMSPMQDYIPTDKDLERGFLGLPKIPGIH
ncbi:hypothetical protein CBE01nite_49310 [Clostridium beijerinckii]|nr:hypothetical protein CBE01nite_49310 [Clostridium beijerinckii]